MDGEDVRQFDVQGWLGLRVEVVELVNVEMRLGIWYRDDCKSVSDPNLNYQMM